MTARGEGLARWRAARAEKLWPAIRTALDALLAEHGAPNKFFFSEIAQRAGVTPRELGSVLRSGGAAAVWLRERAAVIEVQGRSTALVFGNADDSPGVPAPAPAAEPPDSPDEGGSWLPSLL